MPDLIRHPPRRDVIVEWCTGVRAEAASYLPYLPDQDFLLPHSMREWLPEGRRAYYINDTVDSLDLKAK